MSVLDNIKDVEISTASADDIRIFYPAGPPSTAYFWIARYKGKPACLAGLILQRGGCVAFSGILPDVKAPNITVWRTAQALLSRICSLNMPMYAYCDLDDKMAQEFVKRLGFTYLRTHQGAELFEWSPSKEAPLRT